jgi:diacylglycerol kinase (ATP)
MSRDQEPAQAHSAHAPEALLASPHKGKTGLRRVWNAFFYSIEGFRAAYRHEDAFRQETLVAAILIPVALFLPASGVGKALLIASVLLVLLVELLNSAVEATVDRISLENHQLAKRAKDIGSAAVFVSLLNALVVWVLVLFG